MGAGKPEFESKDSHLRKKGGMISYHSINKYFFYRKEAVMGCVLVADHLV